MLDGRPEVSVVVGALNAASTIRRQLDALGRQEDAPAFEVVVADNGSTDGTVEVVEQWIEEHGGGVVAAARVVDASARRGIAHARNTGARHARGRLLAFCDADDVVDVRWVSAVAASRIAHEEGAIGGRVMLLGSDGNPTSTVVLESLDGVSTDGPECAYFWGCNFAISRATYETVGGFDESLPPYGCEDIEIGLRLAAGGHRVTYEPAMTVFYAWPQGRRRKFRRNVRAGAAMACVWARHPEAFARTGGVWSLARRTVTAPVRELAAGHRTWHVRAGRAADAFATQVGYLVGDLTWVRAGRLGAPDLFARASASPFAYVTVCSSEAYLEGVLVLAASLRRVGSRHPLTVLLTPAISGDAERLLERRGIRTMRSARSLSVPGEILERNRALGADHWSRTFDKLQVFELVEFGKVVYLDGDMMLLRNVDDLFERPHMSAVVAGRSFPGNESWVLLNSGCLVVVPREGELDRLWGTVPDALREREAIGDQDLLQIAHPDWPDRPELHLGEELNMFFPYLEHYTRELGYSLRGPKPVRIVHFVGTAKPWTWSTRQAARRLARHLRARQWASVEVLARYRLLLARERAELWTARHR